MARNITTTNFGWPNPDSTDKINTAGYWGTDLETCINSIDTDLKSVSDNKPTTIRSELAGNQAITTGSYVAVDFTTNGWVSGTYVPSTSGTYNIKIDVKVTAGSGAGTFRVLKIDVNGARQTFNQAAPYTEISLNGSITASLTSSDSVTSYFLQDAGVSQNLQAGIYTHAEVTKLS